MSKKLFTLLFVMLMLCGAALADGITVTDMHGREIALDQPATRIVALTPSDCEILCAIGCEDALVGRGKYCDYPESISALPVVQSGAETNIEEILALDPQVVLMSDMSQTEEQAKLLEQNGVKVVISDANDIAGVYTAIRMIGALMAKDDAAEALIGDMQATFDEIAAKSEKSGKTIYFEVSPLQWAVDGRKRHVHGRAGDDVRRDQCVCGYFRLAVRQRGAGHRAQSGLHRLLRGLGRYRRGGDHGRRRLGRYRRGEERPGL